MKLESNPFTLDRNRLRVVGIDDSFTYLGVGFGPEEVKKVDL